RCQEQTETPLRVMNGYCPEQHAIFEEKECRPDAKRYPECSRQQGYLNVVPDQLGRECCFGLCGSGVLTFSLLLLVHALVRVAQVICRKQHVDGSRIVVNRDSAKRTTQNRDQHGQAKIAGLPPKRFRKRPEDS